MAFVKTRRLTAENVKCDIKKFHNHSIYSEVKLRNLDNEQGEAIWYKGCNISYQKLMDKSDLYANALWNMGYREGSEIPVCFSNIPQFIYMFLAASKIGAILNSVGEWFNDIYLKDILKNSKSRYFFCSSDYFDKFSRLWAESNIQIYSFSVDVNNMTKAEEHFELMSKEVCSVTTKAGIDIPLTITYTSGTTDFGRPKAVLHASRSYMYLGRYKDSDISGMPSMKGTRIFSHIPFYVHASLSTSVVDPLFQSCCIVLESQYNSERFPQAVIEGKPNQVCASVGFWLKLAEVLEQSSKKIDMSFLYVPTVSGEAMSIGEERYLNHIARKYKFGKEKFPFNIIPVTFSIGGGTSESSGVLVTLFKSLQEKRIQYKRIKPMGLSVLGCAEVCVLDDDKKPVKYGKVGTAWFSGPCNMIRYYYDFDKMEEIVFTDENGKEWIKMEAAVIQQDSRLVKIIGRDKDYVVLKNAESISYYLIQELLYNKIHELMSCDIVTFDDSIVFHLKCRPDKRICEKKQLIKIKNIFEKMCLNYSIKKIYIAFHNDVAYKLAPSGKRDILRLKELGLKGTYEINFE